MMMQIEETSVCIIGGGPVGTLLSADLSLNHGIPNIVLEKEKSIPTDPRAFALLETGVRCLQTVGLSDKIYSEIGTSRTRAMFISGKHHDVNASPFLELNLGDIGRTGHEQALLFDQPTMERCLRDLVKESSVGQFRTGSEVMGIEDTADCAEVIYKNETGIHRVRAKFVVGADGKHGFTRKRYLESKGIKMAYNHPYEAIYVGGNFNVKTPTPESHPKFPLWTKDYSPEEVVELFVPEPFRFMCNPDRQCVMSQFGKRKDGVSWRFERRTHPGEDPDFLAQPKQVVKMVRPYMVHPGSKYGLKEEVVFPEDCLEVRRAFHYKFEARSCTKFHVGRVVVVGDAAHVFPPFAGMGITTGFLDAMGLSWRLATALQPANVSKDPTPLLDGWEAERKDQITRVLKFTMERGAIFDESNPVKIFCRDWLLWLLQRTPIVKGIMNEEGKTLPEYKYNLGMSFLPIQGGKTFSQLFLRQADGRLTFSDDLIFGQKRSLFQLLVLARGSDEVEDAAKELKQLSYLSKDMVDEASYIIQDLKVVKLKVNDLRVARIASVDEFNSSPLCHFRKAADGYDPHLWVSQHRGKRYIIVRPDRFVFSASKDTSELATALKAVGRLLYCDSV